MQNSSFGSVLNRHLYQVHFVLDLGFPARARQIIFSSFTWPFLLPKTATTTITMTTTSPADWRLNEKYPPLLLSWFSGPLEVFWIITHPVPWWAIVNLADEGSHYFDTFRQKQWVGFECIRAEVATCIGEVSSGWWLKKRTNDYVIVKRDSRAEKCRVGKFCRAYENLVWCTADVLCFFCWK